jgi:hypothetical protein
LERIAAQLAASSFEARMEYLAQNTRDHAQPPAFSKARNRCRKGRRHHETTAAFDLPDRFPAPEYDFKR